MKLIAQKIETETERSLPSGKYQNSASQTDKIR